MPHRHIAYTAGSVFFILCVADAFSASQERNFGVVPQQSPITLAERWQPLLSHLSMRSDETLRFATAPTVTEFEERCLQGRYDYAYMNLLLFKEAKKRAGYQAIVRRQRPLTGIIVVRKEGPQTLAQLKNQVLAFPAPHAFGATLVPRAALKQRKIKHAVAYLGTHESAYRSVLQGKYIAAGGVLRSYELLPVAERSQLRILFRSEPVTPHVIAAHPRVPKSAVKKIKQNLLDLERSRSGRDILEAIGLNRFVQPQLKDFSALDRLGINLDFGSRNIDFLVIPRLNVKDTLTQMRPLAAYLRQRLELAVDIKVFETMGKFEQAIYNRKGPALVNANPLQALNLEELGYETIAYQTPVNSPEGMRGLLLVLEDSPYQNIKDLVGKRIAFGGNRNAFFAAIVPRKLLERAGLNNRYIDVSKPGPVSDVVRRLRKGEIDAAGTGTMALHSVSLKKKYQIHKMRVIAQSEPMPGLAWLISPDVKMDLRLEIKQVLLNYGTQAPGHSAMEAAGIAGLRPADKNTYRMARAYLEEKPK